MRRILLCFPTLLALLASVLGAPASAQVKSTVVIQGVPMAAETESFKCDIRKSMPGVSVLRLADCDSARLVTLPKANGFAFAEFKLDPADPRISEGSRSELRDMYEAKNGEEVWYRFTTLLPKNFPVSKSQRIVLAQWHERVPEGSPHLRPPLAHRLVDGDFHLTLWNDAAYDATKGKGNGVELLKDAALELGMLHEYVYRIVWGSGPAAMMTGWRRTGECSVAKQSCVRGAWERFTHHAGPIGYQNAVGYYFKLGLYTTHAFSQPLIAYHRDYRRGPTAASIQASDRIFRSAPY